MKCIYRQEKPIADVKTVQEIQLKYCKQKKLICGMVGFQFETTDTKFQSGSYDDGSNLVYNLACVVAYYFYYLVWGSAQFLQN